MNSPLGATIAAVRQQFEELLRLISLDELRNLQLGQGKERERIATALNALNKAIATLERRLRSIADPLTQLDQSLIKFFRENIEPNMQVLRRAHWESMGLLNLFESLDALKPEHPSSSVKDAMSWGLERWRDVLDDSELENWRLRGYSIETAIEVVELPWFEPDRWMENMRLLRPVLLDRPPEHLRDHVRHRLTEIYRAFTFGLWMSSIALCRSLLEYCLKATASQYNIDPTRMDSRGLREDKPLMVLCDDFSNELPSLGPALDHVRDAGNRIMHVKKRVVLANSAILRNEALEVIRSMQHCLETIYSGAPR